MRITIPFHYFAQIVPKKHRIEKSFVGHSTVEVDVLELTVEQFPLAMRVTHDHNPEVNRDYRWWDGRLWRQAFAYRGNREAEPVEKFTHIHEVFRDKDAGRYGNLPADGDWREYLGDNQAQQRELYTALARRTVFMGDTVWNETEGEPCYKIGGASYNWPMNVEFSEQYFAWSPIDHNNHVNMFRADQRDFALAEAQRLENRGAKRTATIDVNIEVLIPEALRLPYVLTPETRICSCCFWHRYAAFEVTHRGVKNHFCAEHVGEGLPTEDFSEAKVLRLPMPGFNQSEEPMGLAPTLVPAGA